VDNDQSLIATQLSVVRPGWDAPTHVRVFNTTRVGGVSQPPFDSLNLGLHVNDDAAHVHENRARVISAEGLPSAPNWLKQVHGTRMLTLPMAQAELVGAEEADAAMTTTPDTVLAIMTADCLPVVMCNETGTRLAAAHAGWRSLAGGVLENCLQQFDENEAIHVWLGPAIGPKKFEVGDDVFDAFVSNNANHSSAFAKHPTAANKYLANIYDLARQAILQRRRSSPAVTHISGGDLCTHSDADRFHSHRRDGVRSGRLALFAWLDSGHG